MSEARRLIQQGAVRVGGRRITDPRATLVPAKGTVVVQVGSRRVRGIVFFPGTQDSGGVDLD